MTSGKASFACGIAWTISTYKGPDGISDTVHWHRGRCLSYGDGVSFWALAEMVRGRLGILEGDAQEVVAERLRLGLERYVVDADER